jgi:cell wall-associated NlpC family hydrolase
MSASQIDLFMAAIRALESGGGNPRGNYSARNSRSGAYGAYQIMPQNWPSWAREAGVPGADPRDPRMQDIVARHKMLQYYRQYGRWDHVAGAWFAGPGGLRRHLRGGGDPSDGNLRVSQYMNRIRSNMREFGGGEYGGQTDLSFLSERPRTDNSPPAGRSFPDIDVSADLGFPDIDVPLPGSSPDSTSDMFEAMLFAFSRAGRGPDGAPDPSTNPDALATDPGALPDINPLEQVSESLLDQNLVAEGGGQDPWTVVDQSITDSASAIAGLDASTAPATQQESELLDQLRAALEEGATPAAPTVDSTSSTTSTTNSIINEARKYLGTPYVWGGTSPKGFDCSGLIQYVFRNVGIDLPRTSAEQARAGTRVADVSQAQPGDLMFWRGQNGRPNHIVLYIGGGKILEAPRTGLNVRIRDLTRTPDMIRRVTGGS